MSGGRETARGDRSWQGAILASCLVHLCLVASGWLLLQPVNRSPQRSQVVRVTLSAPQAKEITTSSAEEGAATPLFAAPPTVREQPPMRPPVRSRVNPPAQLPPLPKLLTRPVLPAVIPPAVKPVNEIFVPAKPALASASEARQLEPSAAGVRTIPVVATTTVTTAVANTESSVAAEPTAVNEDGQELHRERYLAQLRQQIERYQKYPLMARKGRQQGVVVVEFELSRRGELQRVLIRESCGKRLLDQAALQAVEAAAPFPVIPPQLLLVETIFVVPLRFILDK